jgi:lipopolysaccharide/colanic/teichoic acid biosynthesis glycosyltransferase
MFNLDVLDAGRMRLIINLHKLNDLRWFNRYFLMVHEKLAAGGYIMGKAHTIATHRAYFREKYPKYLGTLFYAASFVWGRVFPKLPWLQKFYFAVTRGRGRMVSRAEILGRLSFCGFKIVDEREFGHRFYFIAQKTHAPSDNRHPTYGPLVRLRRSGQGGRPITVYKFRTMYPYSEFLQDYVYTHNALAEGGKFKDDFRVTGWGAFMRRTWLDELPMLYNWLRGDLQLVGVRPLSSQYQQLYDADLRALRQKVKPGLLPPFYADMPKTLEEIQASERRYIEAYLKRPLRTQLVYLFKGVWNIVVKRRRSA